MTVNTKKAEWAKENMRTLSCRVRTEEAEKFRKYAEYLGKSTHSILSTYVSNCLNTFDQIPEPVVTEVEELRTQIKLLKRKLDIAKRAVEVAQDRAVRAEALVDEWLRSDDAK